MTTITNNVSVPRKSRQPSKALKQRVRSVFSADDLIDICGRDGEDFSDFGQKVKLQPSRYGDERFFYFQDNGSDILAVAHLDTVQNDRSCTVTRTAAGLLACSGGLDDRLGAYVILDMLPKLGIQCDILLTTDEEMGQSTGAEFEPHKQYNWMIQFDRGGTDVVMYQYETPERAALVEDAGARVGDGSYSDIADLDHLGCAGFNWGVGYQDYHSERSHAWLEDTFRMVARFVKFYEQNGDVHLAYTYGSREDWLTADCGHEVNIDDPRTYVEEDFDFVCRDCAEKFLLETGADQN